jgi:AraC family transcriptional regulator of arabinose operon
MRHSSDIELERALAGFFFGLMRGLEITPTYWRMAYEGWNHLVLPSMSAEPMMPAEPEAYLRASLDNLQRGGFLRACRQWESRFDWHGVPLPGADIRTFLTDMISVQYHSPHAHHDFFCICPTFAPGSVMDIQIRHPFAADFWAVYLTEAGTGIIETRSGETDLLVPGSIAVIPPGFRGRVGRARESDQWRCHHLGFRPKPGWLDFLTVAFRPSMAMVLRPVSPTGMTVLREGFNELALIKCQKGDINEKLSFNLIENVLIRLCRQFDVAEPRGTGRFLQKTTDPRINAAVDFVLSHYDEPLAVADIAARSNLSPSRLAALFKSQFGMSLIQWRDSVRLARARDLVATTTLQISEIARQVGWEDQLYFSKRFKTKYGDSPRSYRKWAERRSGSSKPSRDVMD